MPISKPLTAIFVVLFVLGGCSTADTASNMSSGEESLAIQEEPEEEQLEIPMPGENSDHGYLVEVSRIPRVDNCDQWMDFWMYAGPALSFQVAAQHPEIADLHVSTQIYLANKHLDEDLDGILCSDSDGQLVGPPQDVVEKVVRDIRSFRETPALASIDIDLDTFAGPGVPGDVFEHYVAMVERASIFWAQFNSGASLVKSVTVVANEEKREFDQRRDELGMGSWGDDMWRRSGGGGGTVGTNDEGYSQVFFRLGPQGGDKPYDDYAYHEITHSYQDLFDTFDPVTGGPCWFGEGYAKVVGHANTFIDDRRNLKMYREQRENDIVTLRGYFSLQDGNLSAQLSEVLRYTHSHRQCNTEEPLFGYRLGWLVSEAWVEEFGFAKTVDFMKGVEGGAFESHFEVEFGIAMDEWLETRAKTYVLEALTRN